MKEETCDAMWKTKLKAFLHDSPTKALDIRSHEERADAANQRAGTADTAFDKSADWLAASADRVPFPYYRTSKLSCAFDGVRNAFRHPLGGDAQFPFSRPFASSAQGEETEQVTQPSIMPPAVWSEADKSRAAFFAHWRLWRDYAVERDARFACLPADTRLPDHTIWNHCGIASAFASCGGAPALLRFQLGPVQDFIAAARTTRDLWSASYLLSWLMTSGLKRLSERAGPDAVLFPNLHGQPLFDFQWKNALWSQLNVGEHTRLSPLRHSDSELVTPNLPNVFLALVPAADARVIVADVENAIRAEWQTIADAVWAFAFRENPATANRDRFDDQIARHLSIAWQTTPFPASLDDAETLASQLPDPSILARFRLVRREFEKDKNKAFHDRRFYTDDAKTKLNSIGLAWSLIVALNHWQLDAVRKTRVFLSPRQEKEWAPVLKDALTGVEEQVFTDKADLSAAAMPFFKHDDPVAAATLVKRLWHLAYLRDRHELPERGFNMPNTYDLAQQRGDDWEVNSADDADTRSRDEGKYFAVLAFDGDDMGKWVSGEKAPPFRTQLADYVDADGVRKGALEYFERIRADDFLNTPRLLTPSYHLQFSQALSNFALYAAPRVVAAHKGRLIYAGGDDVLAMLPADTALACANDLQRVFRGLAPNIECGIRAAHPGFLTFDRWETDRRRVFPAKADRAGNPLPFVVPGPRATASCGVAIAHFKAPLQDVVRAAQAAEKRAKRKWASQKLKHAFALTILKRSGEITEWDARFDNDDPKDAPAFRRALPAFFAVTRAMDADVLSANFPHKMLAFIAPYRSRNNTSDLTDFPVKQAVLADLATVMDRQRGASYNPDAAGQVSAALKAYLDCLPDTPADVFEALTGLFTAAAFIVRQ